MNEREINVFIDIVKENRITTAAKIFTTVTAMLYQAAYGIVPEKLKMVASELGWDTTEFKHMIKCNFYFPHTHIVYYFVIYKLKYIISTVKFIYFNSIYLYNNILYR